MNKKLISKGDLVKLKGNPFDEQIPEELELYNRLKDKVQKVVDIKDVSKLKGTSGLWIKTDVMSEDWTDYAWFEPIPQPIQKEEECFNKQPEGNEKCRCGHIVKECYYNQTNGEEHQRKEGEPLCSHCYSFPTPSDTFIEKEKTPICEAIKEFERLKNLSETVKDIVYLDGVISVLETFKEKEKDFLKSSLLQQEQRVREGVYQKGIEEGLRQAGYLKAQEKH